jgi:4-aminobutyrate aminotransferase-like enzyme
MLSKQTPGQKKKIHFATGGAEAVEVALKLAKLYTKRHEIISFYGGWHGRTHATLALSGLKEVKQGSYPLLPGVVFLPYPYCYRCPLKLEYSSCSMACVGLVESAIEDPLSGNADVGAIIIEPIQGYGGHIVPPDEFLPSVQKICQKNNVLLIADEIYTGFGRTGKMFAVEHWGIIPDLHVLGKGLTGCLPLSVVVGRNEIMDASQGIIHSMTFQANPISCAAAIANLEIIQEMNLVEASAKNGRYFMKRLSELAETHQIIGDVRGKGLLIGVELVEDRTSKKTAIKKTRDLILYANKKGIIVDVAARPNILRVTPPLVITRKQIDSSVEVLDEALKRLT